MSQIFNKSQHPVAVKRIPVRVWSLRDEIEAALARRIKECEVAGLPLYIDDIKLFYGMQTDKPLTGQPQLQLVESDAPVENVDQMMEAIAETATPPEEVPQEAAPTEEKPSEQPVEAAAPTEAPALDGEAKSEDAVKAADEMIAAQTSEEKKEAPAVKATLAPYTRQAPDSDKISYGFVLLSDVNMDWMLAFSKEPYIPGQSIVAEFLIPRSFKMSAEIMMCSNYSMRSRIISQNKTDFRLQCRFTYALQGERTNLRDFLTSIEPEIPKKSAPPAKQAEEEAGP
ncbi:MAG: hypothetical protein K2P81_01400 [Bacteriovoracaceae bacterium]|nr:hypothetical protein [Bacteriovoracaceae bacterium]